MKIVIKITVENAQYPGDEITKFVNKYIVGWISNDVRQNGIICSIETSLIDAKNRIQLSVKKINEDFAFFYKLANVEKPIIFNVEFL